MVESKLQISGTSPELYTGTLNKLIIYSLTIVAGKLIQQQHLKWEYSNPGMMLLETRNTETNVKYIRTLLKSFSNK